jgi:hypothetical protein
VTSGALSWFFNAVKRWLTRTRELAMQFEIPFVHLASEILELLKSMESKMSVIDDLATAVAANTKAVADLEAAIAAHPGLDTTPITAAVTALSTNNASLEAAVAAMVASPVVSPVV